jgi:hypothetical protein
MAGNWKTAVYEYIHHRNQLEIEYQVEPLFPLVRDDRYLRRQQVRLRRLQASDRERGVRPVRSETGLVIDTIDDRGRQLVVDVDLRRNFEYELRRMKHAEERRERERIYLEKDGSRWQITGVEADVPERRSPIPPHPETLAEMPPEPTEARMRSLPYLNNRVFPGVGSDSLPRAGRYNRMAVQEYANRWWNAANPDFQQFEVDCTSFVSQCLFAGGAPMNYTGKRETGWWYQGYSKGRELWSYSWAVAHSLCTHLTNSRSGLRAEIVHTPQQLTIGDVICYDWDGNGRFQHNTIVTAIDAAGMPLVNAHTVNSKHRYWDYRDSYAWTPNTKYRFFHIADHFG